MIQTIFGKVIEGKKIGGKFLFKTANILYSGDKVSDGVYKINVVLDGKKYPGVGTYSKKKGVFESHIFDFEKNIYGKKIKVYILQKIRENKKFDSLINLKIQIEKDIEIAKTIKMKVMTFGTFDLLHLGHEFYLKQASFYGDKLITIIARDKNVKLFKKKLPKNSESVRFENVKNLGVSDIVELGDLENPFSGLEKYNPQIICLGYDQKGFFDKLQNHKEYIYLKILRIKSYKPEIYKSSKLYKNN